MRGGGESRGRTARARGRRATTAATASSVSHRDSDAVTRRSRRCVPPSGKPYRGGWLASSAARGIAQSRCLAERQTPWGGPAHPWVSGLQPDTCSLPARVTASPSGAGSILADVAQRAAANVVPFERPGDVPRGADAEPDRARSDRAPPRAAAGVADPRCARGRQRPGSDRARRLGGPRSSALTRGFDLGRYGRSARGLGRGALPAARLDGTDHARRHPRRRRRARPRRPRRRSARQDLQGLALARRLRDTPSPTRRSTPRKQRSRSTAACPAEIASE